MKKFLPFAVLSLLIVGCTATPPQPPAEKWHRLDDGKFSLRAPQDWQYREEEGTDSKVGTFYNQGISLGYDLGHYSNQLSEYDNTDMASYEKLDGHIAKIVIDKKRMIVGMYIADIEIMPVVRPGSAVDLCITSKPLKNEAEIQLVLKIFRTIEFMKIK